MSTKIFLFSTLFCASLLNSGTMAQTNADEPINNSGMFSLGVRNTLSLFNSHEAASFGAGGHFRIQLSDRVNTEWFADFIKSSTQDLGRTDYHIGWSVMYYVLNPTKTKFVQPYIEAGHCFDYTQLRITSNNLSKDRWSSAMQMGIGVHFNITPRFDITLKSQYMLHLGGHLHAHKDINGIFEISEHEGFEAEGHLLNTISLNYKIGRIWKR
jgi:hypothetical protein